MPAVPSGRAVRPDDERHSRQTLLGRGLPCGRPPADRLTFGTEQSQTRALFLVTLAAGRRPGVP